MSDELKAYLVGILRGLHFDSGFNLEWDGKKLPVYHDHDGYFWLNAKCYTIDGAVEAAAEHIVGPPKPVVYIVLKESESGCRPIKTFKNRADAEGFANEQEKPYHKSDIVHFHVCPMEVN